MTLALASVITIASCARSSGEPAASEPAPDPKLVAAADKVQPILETRHGDSYAGLKIDVHRSVLAVYRQPDAGLDAVVREMVPGVAVELRDARFSLAEMKAAADRIMAERAYWQGEGVAVTGTAPETDGSGVLVMVAEARPGVGETLQRRYPTMPIRLVTAEVMFPDWRESVPPIKVGPSISPR